MKHSIYFVRAGADGPIKIGYAENVKHRLTSLQSGNHLPLAILHTLPGGEALERHIHAAVRAEHLRGEWFNYTPFIRVFLDNLISGVPLDGALRTYSESRHIFEAANAARATASHKRVLRQQRRRSDIGDGLREDIELRLHAIGDPSPRDHRALRVFQNVMRSRARRLSAVARKVAA